MDELTLGLSSRRGSRCSIWATRAMDVVSVHIQRLGRQAMYWVAGVAHNCHSGTLRSTSTAEQQPVRPDALSPVGYGGRGARQ